MKLSEYLEIEKITHADFGRLIGVTSTSVYRYAHGLRRPEQETMLKIGEITSGQVTANDFYGIEHAPQITGHHPPVN